MTSVFYEPVESVKEGEEPTERAFVCTQTDFGRW